MGYELDPWNANHSFPPQGGRLLTLHSFGDGAARVGGWRYILLKVAVNVCPSKCGK
jgi:hypothetical protein